MHKLAIYEDPDNWEDRQELADLAASLDILAHQNVEFERHDLAKEPEAFENNPTVAQYMKVLGIERLPVVLADGVIIIAGRYPDDFDLIDWLELPPEVLGYDWVDEECDDDDCCCGHHGDHDHHDHDCHDHES